MTNKPTQKNLEDELDFCHNVMQRTFAVTVEKPKVYTGSEDRPKFFKIESRRDMVMSFSLTFAYEPKLGIYVGDAGENQKTYERAFGWFGMLANVFVEANSPEMCLENHKKLRKSNKERAGAYSVASTGISDYMAIKCCRASGNPDISEEGEKKEKEIKYMLEEFLGSRQVDLMKMSYQTDDWLSAAHQYMKRQPEFVIISGFATTMGQRFMEHFKNPNLKQLLENPPKTIEEVVYPEKYAARVGKEKGIRVVK